MTDIPQLNRTGPKVWRLALPDWGRLDTVWERRLPFALWTVGEQALLFHWLDAAVDQGSEKLVIYVADRPGEVRKAIGQAQLWPIELEIQTVSTLEAIEVDDYVDRLPRTPPLGETPEAGWGLIHYWHNIEQAWLSLFSEETAAYGIYAAIGRSCEIAEDAKLVPPFWLGNHVSIGPGSEIGPNVVIGDGCIVSGNNRIERAHLGAHTYLGPETDLIDAVIHRNNLLNFKHQAYVRGLEGFLASGMESKSGQSTERPSWRDRLRALRLYWRFRSSGSNQSESFTGIEGTDWPMLKSCAPEDRGPWLRLVISGKLSLFGVTPRTTESLDDLPDEWASILKRAPLGAFSYADVMGAPETGEMDEALHCVYQATHEGDTCRQVFDHWLEELLDNSARKKT